MQDNKILAALRKNPNAGMKLLMDQYAGLVSAVVRSKMFIPPFTAEDVEDCVADTFIEFYSSLSKYDSEKCSIKAWLCMIARTNALDRVRRQYTSPVILPLDEFADHSGGTHQEEVHLQKETHGRLLDAVRALGQPDREIILRKFYLSQSSKEIAQRLGLTVSNVDTRTYRAIEKLRKALEVPSHD